MKNNILYIGGFILPNGNAAAQRVVANAKIFRELGYEVSLVGMTRDNSGLEPFEYEGFKCVNLPYPKSVREWWRMLTSNKQYLPFYRAETAIVVAYNHPAVALKRFLKYNRKKGIKTISDCTEWYEPQGGWLFQKIKGWDINLRMYDVHPNLDGIISISKYLDDFYKSKGTKSLLLPPLVDKKEKKWSIETHESDIITLLYAGSPGGTKDRLDFMIDALNVEASKGKSFCFEIIGITEQQYREVYLQGSNIPIPAFLTFKGRIPHEEVIKRLKEADFQIFLREDHLANRAGFPTKFAETISAGTIVLTNASSNLKDYMVEGVNSFELDTSSKDALVNSLMKPLSMEKEKLRDIQRVMDTNVFDYRNYIEKAREFLLSL